MGAVAKATEKGGARVVRIARVLISGAVLVCLSFVSPAPGLTQYPPPRYFSQTGHSVRDEFLAYFDAYGGERIFGYPITEDFFDRIESGCRVQYFQNCRMDLVPNLFGSPQIRLAPLGELLGFRAPPIPPSDIPPDNDPYRRYYQQTGHTLGYAFKTFFDFNGGLDIFGYPITELMVENGLIVQYFQKAKMEWHPERPNEERVQLASLGETYFRAAGLNLALLGRAEPIQAEEAAQTPDLIPTVWSPLRRQVKQLIVYTSLRKTIVSTHGDQSVSVYAADQDGQAISGATVMCTVRYPYEDRVLAMPVTDTNGRSYLTFQLANPPPGYIVFVEVMATYGQARAGGRAAFLTWW
jgi:hypothetical protein